VVRAAVCSNRSQIFSGMLWAGLSRATKLGPGCNDCHEQKGRPLFSLSTGLGRSEMTSAEMQAKAAYGNQAQNSDGRDGSSTKFIEKLIIPSFAVGDIEMKVSIETMPGSNLIKEVLLALADKPQSFTRGSAYTDLLNALMQKYGRPTSQEKDRGENTETNSATWAFPSTVISLFWVETTRLNFGILNLQYTATDNLAFTSPLKSRNSCLFSGAGAMSGPPSLRPLTSKWLVQERLGLGHPP
jgi:hypothetical protein